MADKISVENGPLKINAEGIGEIPFNTMLIIGFVAIMAAFIIYHHSRSSLSQTVKKTTLGANSRVSQTRIGGNNTTRTEQKVDDVKLQKGSKIKQKV